MKDKYISMKELEEGIKKGNIKVINHIIDIKEEDKRFKIDDFYGKYVRPLKEKTNNKKGE